MEECEEIEVKLYPKDLLVLKFVSDDPDIEMTVDEYYQKAINKELIKESIPYNNLHIGSNQDLYAMTTNAVKFEDNKILVNIKDGGV